MSAVHMCSFTDAVYIFEEYYFEWHRQCGPVPLDKRNGNPRNTVPAGFWEMIERFQKLKDRSIYETDFWDGVPTEETK